MSNIAFLILEVLSLRVFLAFWAVVFVIGCWLVAAKFLKGWK